VTRKFALTPDAVGDVVAIWDYLASSSGAKVADRVLAKIYDECDRLATMPGIGHHRIELRNPIYRVWSVWSYLIVCRSNTTPVEVIAIVHGARELSNLLLRREDDGGDASGR